MPINFIPNDPLSGAGSPPSRQKQPHANRPGSRASLQFFDAEPVGLASPGTPQFLFWQAREASLLALDAWERVAGPFTRWQGNRRTIPFVQNAVAQIGATPTLNAFYNRASFQFFEGVAGGQTTFSGESTDVVAHELGHGLLDAIRPDLIEATLLEVGAFHEAFGDCVAILTGLADSASRQAVRTSLAARNFLETTAEDLSEAIRRFRPTHNAAEPRRARNTLQWQLPTTLPDDGGPGVLINEDHSFARVFSGCFYDLILGLAGASPSASAARSAAVSAGRLLVAGARTAPVTARFYQAVGRAMVMADQQLNAGVNRVLLGQVFAGHGVSLGSSAMLAPVAALAGAGPTLSAKSATLTGPARRDLVARLGGTAPAKMAVNLLDIGGSRVAHTLVERKVALGAVHSQLRGVVVRVQESVLVGSSGGRAAVLGAMPEMNSTQDEVMSYVGALMKHKRILIKPEKKKGGAKGKVAPMSPQTHEIVTVGGQRELRRRAFACGCGYC